MQVTVEDSGSNTKSLKIVLAADDVKKELEKAYRKLSKTVSVKGFRKGKVPRKVLEREYGSKIEYDTAEKMIQNTYFDALEQTKLDAVVHPEIRSQKFEDDGTFVYDAEIAVRPEFELSDYKGLEVEVDDTEASDDEVAVALENMQREGAPLRSVEDRGVQDGDVAVVDFQGFHNGQEMKQVKAENFSIEIGSGRFGDEFEKTITGLKKSDKTEREIDFPENFPNPVLAGKKVKFDIEIKEVKERVLPEIDDEFAKDAGNEYNSLDDLKAAIKAKISKEKEDAGAGAMADKLMMQLLDSHEIEVPKRLAAYEINNMIKEMEDNLTNQNMTLESAGLNRDELVEQYKDTATKRVKGDFILKKIAEVESIKLDDGDIENGFKRISGRYNMPVDEVKKYFANRDDLLPFMNELLSEKIIKFLRDNAKIKTVKGGGEALEAKKPAAKKPAAKKPAAKKTTTKDAGDK
ncbi:MAG: trigger factor [Desulfobulbaceae bacterium]|nr:trigger factor [Desulfobulbaceae bacterium]